MKKLIQKIITVFVFITIINIGSLSFASAAISTSTLVDLVNSSRQTAGLNTLTINSKLEAAALAKANDILAKNYFAHVSPDGRQPWDFISAAGYDYVYAGENLAIGYSDNQEVHTAWMNSPSHRENILSPNYREIGIASVSGKYEGAQTTVIVQMFGATDQKTQPAVQSANSSAFSIVAGSSNFSPNKIFTGDTVTFTATITGEASGIYVEVGEQKIDLKTVQPVISGDQKTYTVTAKVDQVGEFPVVLNVTDKSGNKESKDLGKLVIGSKVVAKAGAESKNPISNNFGYIVFAAVLITLGAGSYFLFRGLKQHQFDHIFK